MSVSIAARGWTHPRWRPGFYPDDLPDEWRLTYYNNEFAAVVVPAEQWPGADYGQWLEDTDPRFRFYLQLPPQADAALRAQLERARQALGPRLGGLLAPEEEGEGWNELLAGQRLEVAHWSGGNNPRGLRTSIEQLAGQCVEGGQALLVVEGEPPEVEALRTAQTVAALLGVIQVAD